MINAAEAGRTECCLHYVHFANITKMLERRKAKTQAEEKLNKVFTESTRLFRVEVCNVYTDHFTKFRFADVLQARIEVLTSLNFALSLGKSKKLRQDNTKEFISEQFNTYWFESGILHKKAIP